MTVDLIKAHQGAHHIPLTGGEIVEFNIAVIYDPGVELVRVVVVDQKTGNDSHRTTSDGLLKAGDKAKLPITAIHKMIPEMIEEIVVLNNLLGHVKEDGK